MLQAAMSEASLIIHGPPDMPENAEILGVCGVSIEDAGQNKYGWIVTDFLRWKTLFHRVGRKDAQVSRKERIRVYIFSNTDRLYSRNGWLPSASRNSLPNSTASILARTSRSGRKSWATTTITLPRY